MYDAVMHNVYVFKDISINLYIVYIINKKRFDVIIVSIVNKKNNNIIKNIYFLCFIKFYKTCVAYLLSNDLIFLMFSFFIRFLHQVGCIKCLYSLGTYLSICSPIQTHKN